MFRYPSGYVGYGRHTKITHIQIRGVHLLPAPLTLEKIERITNSAREANLHFTFTYALLILTIIYIFWKLKDKNPREQSDKSHHIIS